MVIARSAAVSLSARGCVCLRCVYDTSRAAHNATSSRLSRSSLLDAVAGVVLLARSSVHLHAQCRNGEAVPYSSDVWYLRAFVERFWFLCAIKCVRDMASAGFF